MKAIRGATTIETDSVEDIRESVSELLNTIKDKNNLDFENIICIMFSNTSDIHSFYPAKAAREAGFISCALYSSLEPDIQNSLEKCIRVMVLAEMDNVPQNIYLRRAVSLRKDISTKFNIAIDGPAGSGKSTVAKIISRKFDILYLDTGAMYRACASACIQNNVDCKDESAVNQLLSRVKISVKYELGKQTTLLNGINVTKEIRTPEISMNASFVSAHKCIRDEMVKLQREIASANSCVLDGRDIGTNVLPNAEFKFFLTASPEVRAERRLNENSLQGISQPFESVLKEIVQRDKQDMSRSIAPLVKASAAIEINTDNLTVEEVVEQIINCIQRKI